jgi:DNA-binding beta-propeller fold protein YncE
MKSLGNRYTLAMGAAAALLAGCGVSQQISQTPSQLQGDAASTPFPAAAPSLGASRQLPRYPKRSHDLLYVTGNYPNAIDIFPLTGPNQKQIGSITDGVIEPWGLSIDANNTLYVANGRYPNGTVTVYPYGSTSPSMTYQGMYRALYALGDPTGHVYVSGQNRHGRGHVLEFNAGVNRVIAQRQLGSETDGIAEDRQGNLYVAYRGLGKLGESSIAEFGPGLTNMLHLHMKIELPQGLLVDRAGNIIVVESKAQRIDVFPPGTKTPSVTVSVLGIDWLAGLAMQKSETTLWVSSISGYVYSMPYPLTASTVASEYEEVVAPANGIAVTP